MVFPGSTGMSWRRHPRKSAYERGTALAKEVCKDRVATVASHAFCISAGHIAKGSGAKGSLRVIVLPQPRRVRSSGPTTSMRSSLPFDHSFEMSRCLLCRDFSVDNGLLRSRRMTEDALHERRVRGVVRKDLGSDEMAKEVKIHAKTGSPQDHLVDRISEGADALVTGPRESWEEECVISISGQQRLIIPTIDSKYVHLPFPEDRG